jgi:HTH-type transcriptional regulator/antitoxin MqsA
MKCPECGAAELVSDTRDLSYTYQGHTTVIPGVTGDFCPACGECVLDRVNGDRYSAALGAARAKAVPAAPGGTEAGS